MIERPQYPNIAAYRMKIAGAIAAGILVIIILFQFLLTDNYSDQQMEAMQCMEKLTASIAAYCKANNIPIDPQTDPGLTGLIGPEWSEITTTLGHLDAKRTSIQPDFAALMVTLFEEAGARTGDTVGLACSGSFPGLMLATLAATEAMELHCKIILSLGASSYGANRIDFTIHDIYQVLVQEPAPTKSGGELGGISLGGGGDIGRGWDKAVIEQMVRKIEEAGVPFIHEASLSNSVSKRGGLIGIKSRSKNREKNKSKIKIKVLVNAGGAEANIGTSASILSLKPGVVRKCKLPPREQQGLIHLAISEGIPVIHLLYLKGLVQEYELKWDPVGDQSAE